MTDPARLFVIEARARLDDAADLVRHCLGQLDDARIWRRPSENQNSIGNLVLHLAGNLRQRFAANIDGRPDVRDRFGEFTSREETPKAELLRRFDEAVAAAGATLQSLTPETLVETRRVPDRGREVDATVLGTAFRAVAHLTGHAQEIVYMTRSWIGDRYEFRSPSLAPPEMRPGR